MEEKLRRFHLFLFFVFLALAIPAANSLADEVVLANGDKLTGTIVKVEAGKLTLKTEYAGAIEILIDKVKKIVTDNPAEIHLIGGEVLKGKIRTTAEGKLAVEPSPDRAASTVEMNKVVAINPPPKPPAKLTGNIALGGSLQTGNTDRRSFAAAADASIRGERDRFGVRFLFNYAEEKDEVTARNLYGALKYDYFFTKKFYGYLGLEMLKDRFKDLNLRTIVGPGVGYQIWDDPIKFLLFEAGITYYSEDRRTAEDDSWVAARLAGNFRYTLSKFLTFSDRLEIYPSLANANDFTLRNEAAILSPIGAGWSLKLANILEYDNDPPRNVSKTDLTWILGLQYSF